MILTGAESIRDVVAVSQDQRGQDLMRRPRRPVDPAQLKDLHIKLDLA